MPRSLIALALFGLAAAARADEPADLVIDNAKVVTLDPADRLAGAVAVPRRPDRRRRLGGRDRCRRRPEDRADRRGRGDPPAGALRQPRPPPRRRDEREGPRDPVVSLARRYQGLHRRAGEGPAEGDVDRRPLRLPDPARRGPVPDPGRTGRDRARSSGPPPGGAGGDGQHEGAGGLGRSPRRRPTRPPGGSSRDPIDGRADGDDPQRLLRPQGAARLHLGRRRRGRRRAGEGALRASTTAGGSPASATARRASRPCGSTGASATAAS